MDIFNLLGYMKNRRVIKRVEEWGGSVSRRIRAVSVEMRDRRRDIGPALVFLTVYAIVLVLAGDQGKLQMSPSPLHPLTSPRYPQALFLCVFVAGMFWHRDRASLFSVYTWSGKQKFTARFTDLFSGACFF